MKYRQVMQLLLLLTVIMTHFHSPEGAHMSSRFHDDPSKSKDLKPFAVALTAPPHALPADVARLDDEAAADAAAIRHEAAMNKQRLWKKAKQSAAKHKQGQATMIAEQQRKNQQTVGEHSITGPQKEHHHQHHRPRGRHTHHHHKHRHHQHKSTV